MSKNLLCLASIVLVFSLSTAVSYGQFATYEFDGGGDGTSWSDPNNWEYVSDPNGVPVGGNPATPPGPTTDANVSQLGAVVDPNSHAHKANIGTASGAGSLALGAGAGLAASDDIIVGAGGTGTFTMSGGAASTGDDFNINANSSATVTGGTINVGDRINMLDNAILNNDGGTIIADDDFFFFDDSQITNDSGLMEVADKMRFDFDPNSFTGPKLTINGGIVRTQEYHFDIVTIDDFVGVTEVNGDGLLQVLQGDGSTPSELTVRMARDLIAEGVHLVTSELAPKQLGAFSVVVPSSLQGTDVTFTQVMVVPEPASVVLLGLGSLGLLLRRKRAFKVAT